MEIRTIRRLEVQTSVKDRSIQNEVKYILDLLRNKGDHENNRRVVDEGEGELIVARWPNCEFEEKKYAPCPGCYLWLKLTDLTHHRTSRCISRESDPASTSLLKHKARTLKGIASNAPDFLVNNVINRMKDDEITEIAKGDQLICDLGTDWWVGLVVGV